MGVVKAIGRAIGGLLAPVAAAGALVRGARLFHPSGVVYRADVRPLSLDGALGQLAMRLPEQALVRLSSAFFSWHGGLELPDLLGVAVRLRRRAAIQAEADPGDQDLLFASASHVPLAGLALLTTNVRDFLANDYFAITPFKVHELGGVNFRLVPQRPDGRAGGRDRFQRLEQAVAAGRAVFRLEVRQRRLGARWMPLASITLRNRVAVDQDALRFNPYRTGLGIEPSGLVNALRVPVYPASQLGRTLAKRAAR